MDCFDCIDSCRQKAISFGPAPKKSPGESIDEYKRQFLKSTLVIAALAPAALEAKVTGKKDTRVPMSPPGSVSHRNLLQHCPVQAVHIEGNPIHLEAKAPEQDNVIETTDFDFGF